MARRTARLIVRRPCGSAGPERPRIGRHAPWPSAPCLSGPPVPEGGSAGPAPASPEPAAGSERPPATADRDAWRAALPLLARPGLLREAVRCAAREAREMSVEAVAGTEPWGFLFGPPIALLLGVPFVPLDRAGRSLAEEGDPPAATGRPTLRVDGPRPPDGRPERATGDGASGSAREKDPTAQAGRIDCELLTFIEISIIT